MSNEYESQPKISTKDKGLVLITERDDCRVIPMGLGEGKRYLVIGFDKFVYTPDSHNSN